jgi:hypothetical protein
VEQVGEIVLPLKGLMTAAFNESEKQKSTDRSYETYSDVVER